MLRFKVEYTDTFAGEANYAWVRRETLSFEKDPSHLALIRAAKRAMSLSGVRGRVFAHGDLIEFRPYGMCVVLFVSCVEGDA